MNSLAQALASGASLSNVPGLLKQIIRQEMWRRRYVKQINAEVEYRRFSEFVEDHPPEGLHTSISTLIKICRDYDDNEAVDMLSQVSAGKPGGNNNPYGRDGKPYELINHNNIMVDSYVTQGTSTSYTMRRLAKDFPDIHEQVIAGELTPNSAAQKAGFRRPKFQLVADDPQAAGKYLAQRVDREWFEQLIDAYYKHIESSD